MQGLALKEWAIAVEALAKGEQMIVLRKGGIREETKHFDLRGSSFWLFPTFEHQKPELLQPQYVKRMNELKGIGHTNPLPISVYAEVVREWQLMDESLIKPLSPFHIWNESFVDLRLHWKRQQPLHVLALRVYQLREPFWLEDPLQYAGCKSWLELPLDCPSANDERNGSYSMEEAVPMEVFEEQLRALEKCLTKV